MMVNKLRFSEDNILAQVISRLEMTLAVMKRNNLAARDMSKGIAELNAKLLMLEQIRSKGYLPIEIYQAQANGINGKRMIVISMLISGGMAGLAGAIEVLGVQHRLLRGMASNFGFDGVAVALLGANNPIGMFLAGILLGAMKSGGNAIQMFTGVPSSVVDLIRALVIVFVLINVLRKVLIEVKKKKEKKEGAMLHV